MAKTHTTITLDPDVQREAVERRINISEAAEQGIRRAIGMDEIEEKKETLSPKMKEALEMMTDSEKEKAFECVGRDTKFARGWKRRIKIATGINVSEEEIIKVFGKKK